MTRARFVAYLVLKIMKSVYQHVWVDQCLHLPQNSLFIDADSFLLKENLNNIVRENPVLYLPMHRSYADFVLLSFVCFQMNLPLPTIAAGNNFLSLNQVASLLRSCGAFFIRRSFKNSDDKIYPLVFRAYVQQLLLGSEMPLECFIEGARARSGKSLSPKIGFLKTALQLLWSSQIENLVILPISICYDRILEEELYAKELSPPHMDPSSGIKPKETTKHLIDGAKAILADNYGSVYVRFGEPINLQDINTQDNGLTEHSQISSSATLYPTKHEVEFLNKLGAKIISHQQDCSIVPVFSFFAATVFPDLMRRTNFDEYQIFTADIEYSLDQVISTMEILSNLIPTKNCAHKVFGISLREAFIDSLIIHRKLVELVGNRNLQVATTKLFTVTKLRSYSNQFLQLVIKIAMSLYAPSFSFYSRLHELLQTEFVLQTASLEEYESFKLMYSKLPEDVKILLESQIDYFIVNYNRLIRWIFMIELQPSNYSDFIQKIQSKLNVSLDLVQNFVQLAIFFGAIQKDSKSLLTFNRKALKSLADLITSLSTEKPSLHLSRSIKSKL